MFKFENAETAKKLLKDQFEYECETENGQIVLSNSDGDLVGEFADEADFLDFCNDFWELHKHNFMNEDEIRDLEKQYQ